MVLPEIIVVKCQFLKRLQDLEQEVFAEIQRDLTGASALAHAAAPAATAKKQPGRKPGRKSAAPTHTNGELKAIDVDETYTIKQAAPHLDMHYGTLKIHINKKLIPAEKTGKKFTIKGEDLLAYRTKLGLPDIQHLT